MKSEAVTTSGAIAGRGLDYLAQPSLIILKVPLLLRSITVEPSLEGELKVWTRTRTRTRTRIRIRIRCRNLLTWPPQSPPVCLHQTQLPGEGGGRRTRTPGRKAFLLILLLYQAPLTCRVLDWSLKLAEVKARGPSASWHTSLCAGYRHRYRQMYRYKYRYRYRYCSAPNCFNGPKI